MKKIILKTDYLVYLVLKKGMYFKIDSLWGHCSLCWIVGSDNTGGGGGLCRE